MAGIMVALSVIGTLGKILAGGSPDEKTDARVKRIFKEAKDAKIGLLTTDGSITRLLSNYIIEPVIIASKSAKSVDNIDKILELNCDIFSSYYLQAFEILKNVHKLDIASVIRVLGTDNASMVKSVLSRADHDNKSYLYDLLSSETMSLSIENAGGKPGSGGNTDPVNKPTVSVNEPLGKDSTLSTVLQRSLEIRFTQTSMLTSNDPATPDKRLSHVIYIPITVKAHVIFTDINNILNLLKPNATDKKFSYRLDEYKAGAISLKDLIFAGDIISEYRKNRINDKDQLLALVNARTESANAKLLTNKIVGFEKFYNMLVVTTSDKVRIDKHLNNDFYVERHKQELLTQANAMTVTVLDQDYERGIILTKDIRGKSDFSFKSIGKRRDDKVDLGEIMKAMMTNRSPSF